MVLKNKIFLNLILGIFFISLISATSIGFVKSGDSIELTQICSNCTYVNLTQVLYPNNTYALLGEFSMTQNGTNFNFSFSDTITLGNYFYSTCGDLNGVVTCQSVEFVVTSTGFKLTEGEAIIYLVIALGVFLLFILSFYFMLATPYSNKIDEKTGAVIQLTKLKYVKLGFIMLTWILLTWLLNILVALSDNLVNLSLFFGFFGFMFDLMNRLALPFGIIIIVIGFFEIIRDANLYENLKKLGETMR